MDSSNMKDPTAQDLKHQIAIQEPIETQADDGSTIQTWRNFAWCRASVQPLSGMEFFSASATVQAMVSGRIWVRYIDGKGTTPKMRVQWGERLFQITSVIDFQERHLWLQLMGRDNTGEGHFVSTLFGSSFWRLRRVAN